jgi:hypothetical protein
MGKQARLKRERTANRDRVVALYGELAGPILLKRFAPNCCVNGTRVFIDTMRAFDVPARAQVVAFTVYNKRWVDRMTAKGGYPTSDAEADEWIADGAWALGARNGDQTDGFSMHLVGIANGVLVDSALGQANRPAKGLILDQVLTAPVTSNFGAPGTLLSGEVPGGGLVVYSPAYDDSYLHASGWQQSPWNMTVATEITQAIRGRLNVAKYAINKAVPR